jgi:NAD(P)-dependent dehydrogenase (short-subunit alcohol dehydrogenase family)
MMHDRRNSQSGAASSNDEVQPLFNDQGGIHAFVRSLAPHLIDKGIRVNAPGPVWTPLIRPIVIPKVSLNFAAKRQCAGLRSRKKSHRPLYFWRRQAAAAT